MLSNSLWIMPTSTRSNAEGTATIFYRCGSQQGKKARDAPSDLSQADFDTLTAGFVAAEAETYRKARATKQKNANRNLKKYFDAREIALIEEHEGVITPEQVLAIIG
jgi:hypothetical protein